MRNFVLSKEVLTRKIQSTLNAANSNKIGVMVEDTYENHKCEYSSMTEAGRAIGVSRALVSQALSNNIVVKKRYIITKKK